MAAGSSAAPAASWVEAIDPPKIFFKFPIDYSPTSTFERHDVGLDPGAVPNHSKTDWSSFTMATDNSATLHKAPLELAEVLEESTNLAPAPDGELTE